MNKHNDILIENVSCNGFSDGSLDLSTTGGTPPFQYHWDSKIINTNRYKEALVSFATKPLKAFQISSKTALKSNVSTSNKVIEFIFEEGDNAIRNMDNYLSKNNIQLLFASREKNKLSSLSSTINCAIMYTN